MSSAPNEQKKESDKKQKKKDKKKKKKDSKKAESKEKQAAVEKKNKSSKAKDKKKSSKVKDDPSSKIPSVKEWAKQEELKKKADKKQQKKALKQEKKKQKQVEKQATKAEKQKKAQKLKEEKELKKAENEAAKAKKAAEKAEKAAAKAKEAAAKAEAKKKEVAAKAEAKKKEKHAKWERRMQQMLDESDKQMAADLERDRMMAEERKRKQQEKAREMVKSITNTEQIIKALQEKLENKEKKVAQLSARRDGNRRVSIMAAFKLNYKIANYNRRIHGIGSLIGTLKKKVELMQEEVEKLGPHLLDEAQIQEDEQAPCCSKSLLRDADRDDDDTITANDVDDNSILDMLGYLDSESDYSDDDEDDDYEEDLPIEGMEGLHPNIQELLRKAQKHLEKMDEDRLASAYYDDDYSEPSYVGKGKGPANGREYIKKHL